jgi:hypothetical protein
MVPVTTNFKTADTLRRIGQTLFGSEWKTDLARSLVPPRAPFKSMRRNIERWANEGVEPPEWLWAELGRLCLKVSEDCAALAREINGRAGG